MSVKPISPNEIADGKIEAIPEDVIKVWNRAIALNYVDGISDVKQDAIVKKIMKAMDVERHRVFEEGWLEIEPIYEAVGWKVIYEKPAYNEFGEAYFRFSIRNPK